VVEPLEQEIRTLHAILGSERDPEGRAFAPLAEAYRRAGQPRKAIGLLVDGIRRLPDFATAHVVASRVYAEQGLFQEGELAARSALKIDPENVVAMAALARVLVSAGRHDEAAQVRSSLAALEPEILAEEGLLWDEEEDAGRGGADEPVLELAELAPDEPVLELAELAPDEPVLELAELAPDEPVLELAELAPDEDVPAAVPRIHTRTLAELYAKQGFVDRAVDVLRQLSKERPHDQDLASRLAELEAQLAGGGGGASAPPEGSGRAPAVGDEPEPRDRDQELEALARDLVGHRKPPAAIDTPFAWTQADEVDAPSPALEDGPSLHRYFEELLQWQPGSGS
jgi:tetratricopeptide (TPR) repeat protein